MTSNHRTIRAIAILAGMIALIAAAASYGHQTELLLSWGVGIYSYADKINGRHGDAAFADYAVNVGYGYRW